MERLNKKKAVEIVLVCFLLFAAGTINAQIGIGTPTPNTSAQLDISSTSRGLLPPRMTQAQRDAILKPVAGLMIWCKDCGVLGEIQVYNGGAWMNMTGGYPALPIPTSVVIGTQEWMTKNLDVTTYRNGDTIPQVTDTATWNNLKTGAWCYYNNDLAMGELYGKLYNWYAVTDGRGLAPLGWHIPRQSHMYSDEWSDLASYLGSPTEAAAKMRSTTLWVIGSKDTTNWSGFTGLPGGQRNTDGSFSGMGNTATWWSAADISFGFRYSPIGYSVISAGKLGVDFSRIELTYSSTSYVEPIPDPVVFSPLTYTTDFPVKNYGFFVRCIKD
ncbi:MAG: hypothetical protein JWR61_4640 [Ferruginibacter sp.]|uniref:fibrobacter succinogenes major paralogous domain-containing protein n=1 Tax=Ferruginibacter sp. TaxID=1940288 RepID=UPI002657B420|nr:fibrobacter succinogenes major paralogous domain-containing protein [Ferruginibacter sp.]MDB5279685.1 hypothetical protein [Ferruginibacter sp.]